MKPADLNGHYRRLALEALQGVLDIVTSVGPYSSVQHMPDGAWVECQLFIPKKGAVEAYEREQALLRDIRAALAAGTRHYNRAGRELTTVEQVLRCVADEGAVALAPREERDRAHA